MDRKSEDKIELSLCELNDDCVGDVFSYMNIHDLAEISKTNERLYNLACTAFQTKRFDSMWVKILLRGIADSDSILEEFGQHLCGIKMNLARYTTLVMLDCFIHVRDVAFRHCIGDNLKSLDLRHVYLEPQHFQNLCENAPELMKLKLTRISGKHFVEFTNELIKENFPKLEELIVDEPRLKLTQNIYNEHRCLKRIGIAVKDRPTEELREDFPDIQVATYYVQQNNKSGILGSVTRMAQRNKLKKITYHFEVHNEPDYQTERDEFYMSLFRPMRDMTNLRTLKLCNSLSIFKYFPQIAECATHLEEFHFNTNHGTTEEILVEFVQKSPHLQRIFVTMSQENQVNIESLYDKWSQILEKRDVKQGPLKVFWKTNFSWMAEKVRDLRGSRLIFLSMWHVPSFGSELG